MSNYIERESVLRYQDELEPCLCRSIGQDSIELFTATRDSDLINYIQSIPAADVRPVVRGKWSTVYDDFMKSNYDTCSCCGKEYFGANGFNFCPNCGADMREEGVSHG